MNKFVARLQRINWLQPSVIALLVANAAPLVAVFVFHWDVFSLLFLFWLENVIVGIMNVFKMLLAGVGAKDLPPGGSIVFWALKLFLIPFFCCHYGMFTFVHGIFIVGFFDKGALHGFGGFNVSFIFQIIREHHLEWPFAGLVVSHLISFGWDYLWSGEFRKTNPMELMSQPYRRVVAMQLTIIFGGFLMVALHLPEAALILLVVVKSVIDLWGHQNEREKFSTAKYSALPFTRAPLSPALHDAMQARLQAGASQKLPARPLVFIGVFFAFCLGFICFVTYSMISPLISRPRPVAHSLPPIVPAHPWTLDLSRAQIPNAPPAGTIHGVITHMDRGVLGNGILTLHEGDGRMANTYVVNLPLDKAESLAGRSFRIATNDVAEVPEVKMSWHDQSADNAPPVFTTQTFTNGYAMRLEFGRLAKNKMPVRIYLCLPDAEKDFLAGTLKVTVKKDEAQTATTEKSTRN